MKRRNAKRGGGGAPPVHSAADAPEDVEAPEAAEHDRRVVWDEAWEQPEEERVARWLRARISHDGNAPRHVRIDPFAAPARRSDADPDLYRRDLVGAVGIAETRLEHGRREAMEERSAMEAELRSLEERRQRLQAGLGAQQAEFDYVVAEHAVMRARLEDHVAGLEAKASALEADLATAQAEADGARAAGQQRVAELEERAAALEERRQQLAGSARAEYAEAEAAQQGWSAEAARLQGEIDAFEAYRRELVRAVEAERAEALAARRAREVEAERLQADIRRLEAEAARRSPAVVDDDRSMGAGHAAPANDVAAGAAGDPYAQEAMAGDPGPVPTTPAPGHPVAVTSAQVAGAPVPGPGTPAGSSDGPLDPSGRLAEAMVELGRHTAAVLAAERARADRRDREQQAARARLAAECQVLGSQNPEKEEPVPRRRRGSRYRRRRPAG